MKVLKFEFRGKPFEVNEKGQIKANGLKDFSPNWIFLGGSKHWKNNFPRVRIDTFFKKPEELEKCYGWDRDCGMMRMWGGSYNGKIPRITNVRVEVI